MDHPVPSAPLGARDLPSRAGARWELVGLFGLCALWLLAWFTTAAGVTSTALLWCGVGLLALGCGLRLRRLSRCFGEELTRYDHAERLLRQHTAQSDALLTALPDLIFRLHASGEVTTLSDPARRSQSAAIGELSKLVAEPHATELLVCAGQVLKSGSLGHLEYQRKSGDDISDYEARLAPCGDDQVVVMVRNVTQRKRLERDLIGAREAALEAARMKTKFLANMSHEIRTPMNGVIGMTNLLLETPLSGEQSEYAQIIQKSGHTLLAIIDDILDFAKIEAGKLELEDVEFDLHGCVDESVEACAVQAAAKGLELGAVFAEDVPSRVRGDPTRLRQVLANLLSNAVRFTERGFVLVRVAREDTESSRLCFTVLDSGPGIHEEDQQQLFQPVLLGESTRLEGRGSGLGLAIARELVQLMEGRIRFDPGPSGGSSFAFTARLLPRDSGRGSLDSVTALRGPARVLLIAPKTLPIRPLALQLAALGVDASCVSPGELGNALVPGERLLAAIVDVDHGEGAEAVVEQVAGAIDNQAPLLCVLRPGVLQLQESVRKHATRVLSWPVRQNELAGCLLALLGRPPAPTREPSRSSRSLRVLVADDDMISQRVLKRALTQLGCTIELANDGREAVEKAAAGTFDVIFMDCQMPWLDGFDATLQIRQTESTAHRNRIYAMTASVSDADKQRSRDARMDGFMSKPVPLEQLRELLSSIAAELDGQPALDATQARRLVDQGPRYLDAMRAALDVRDLDAIGKAAENLRTWGEAVGAEQLAVLATQLKAALASQKTSAIERAMEAVSAELASVVRLRQQR